MYHRVDRVTACISIHALLAESDDVIAVITEAQSISIHALLAESDTRRASRQQPAGISIHALLAESDSNESSKHTDNSNFYPRSPCGERPSQRKKINPTRHFYPRSPCGERHPPSITPATSRNFYPRSPCGERQRANRLADTPPKISIHALLAESDPRGQLPATEPPNFYPRSPCGERLEKVPADVYYQAFLSTLSLRRATDATLHCLRVMRISIHALLAESDKYHTADRERACISIHALLAESDADTGKHLEVIKIFLSTLSLRRATANQTSLPSRN